MPPIKLSPDQANTLRNLATVGMRSGRKPIPEDKRKKVIEQLDKGLTNYEIAFDVKCVLKTVRNIRAEVRGGV